MRIKGKKGAKNGFSDKKNIKKMGEIVNKKEKKQKDGQKR